VATGRPTKYDAETFPRIAAGMARIGATDEEVAAALGADVRTLHRWKKSHAEFCHSLKEGKDAADARVQDRLFTRAVGYCCTEKRTKKDAKGAITEEIVTLKEVVPDVTAQIFWLKNRRPDLWRDVSEQRSSTTNAAAVTEALKNRYTPEQLMTLFDRLLGRERREY